MSEPPMNSIHSVLRYLEREVDKLWRLAEQIRRQVDKFTGQGS